jgi:hypothetical protein
MKNSQENHVISVRSRRDVAVQRLYKSSGVNILPCLPTLPTLPTLPIPHF